MNLIPFGVDVKYVITEKADDGIVSRNEYHVKKSNPIHGDLSKLMKDLTEIAKKIIKIDNTILALCFSFSGKDDNIGIVIKGFFESKFGRVKFAIPRIKFKTSESEEAARLTVFADAVVAEVYAYLFENKTADMGIFGE